MSSVIIRPAEPKDATPIGIVHVETWQHAYKGQIPDDYLNSLSVEKRSQRWKEHLEKPDPGKHMWVSEVDGKVVGWSTFGVNRDIDVDKTTAELYGIYILPNFSGQGIGSMLMEKGLNILRAEGYKKASLWVLETNKKSRDWYEGKGWKVEGLTKVDKKDKIELHELRYIIDL